MSLPRMQDPHTMASVCLFAKGLMEKDCGPGTMQERGMGKIRKRAGSKMRGSERLMEKGPRIWRKAGLYRDSLFPELWRTQECRWVNRPECPSRKRDWSRFSDWEGWTSCISYLRNTPKNGLFQVFFTSGRFMARGVQLVFA